MTARCLLCEGICPVCGGAVAEPAGSADWILCSLCHATFRHSRADHDFEGNEHRRQRSH